MLYSSKPWQLIIILSLALYLAGCAGPATAPETIRIGLLLPLTGEYTLLGQNAQQTAELTVNQINAGGGLDVDGNRYQLELIIADDAGLPESAIEAARTLIYQQQVVAVIGPLLSRSAIPATIVAEEAQVPMLLPGATNPEATLGKSFVYRVAFVDSFQGRVMAVFSYDHLQASTAAVLFDVANKYNHDIAHIYRDAFVDLGGEVVAFESYITGTTDFSKQLTVIKEADPDILFLPNFSHEVLAQVEQAQSLDIEATIVGSDSWAGLLPENLALVDGSFFSSHYALDSNNPQAVAFQQLFKQSYDRVPEEAAALTYDAFGLLMQAIQAEGVTPEAIQLGLQQIERYEGVTGTMIYGATGDPERSVVILRIQDGQARYYQTIDPYP
jgi:branched-chain amino acid transport system substrate-binding protein